MKLSLFTQRIAGSAWCSDRSATRAMSSCDGCLGKRTATLAVGYGSRQRFFAGPVATTMHLEASFTSQKYDIPGFIGFGKVIGTQRPPIVLQTGPDRPCWQIVLPPTCAEPGPQLAPVAYAVSQKPPRATARSK